MGNFCHFTSNRKFSDNFNLFTTSETVTSTSSGSYGGSTTTVSGLKASTTNNQVESVSTLASVNLYAVGGGNVVYGEAGKVYSWNSVTKSSTLRIETAPTQVMVSGSMMYFVMGAAHAVYKISMN